jgi:hypothetical protein
MTGDPGARDLEGASQTVSEKEEGRREIGQRTALNVSVEDRDGEARIREEGDAEGAAR